MAQVFLSHAADDESQVRRIQRSLATAGHDVWLAQDAILPGDDIVDAIERAHKKTDYVVVCLSTAALASAWVRHELSSALMRQLTAGDKRVLPVLLEAEVEVPALLQTVLCADLSAERLFPRGLAALIAAIHQRETERGAADPGRRADWTPYLEAVAEDAGHIEIVGIGAGAGEVKGASRYPIERLYTPLRSRDLGRVTADGEAGLRERPGYLAGLLPHYRRLLIEGQPGAGKTTFANLVACMLACDALRVPWPDGGSWRERHLGLAAESPLPVFVRVVELLPVLEQARPARRDDHGVLLEHLDELAAANDLGVARADWEEALADGQAMLLLDGLDEVADERLRARVFAVFRSVCKRYPDARIVVTSRPIDTRRLVEMGFHAATVEPFDRAEIEAFLDRWVRALYEVAPDAAPGMRARQYRKRLEAALVEVAPVRLLASNPVMLTCLCVVHWNRASCRRAARAPTARCASGWSGHARTSARSTASATASPSSRSPGSAWR